MRMRGFLRAGVVAALLCAATPALASDFSGIGRVFWWAVLAIPVLIALIVALIRRLRHPGSREADALLSAAAAVLLAPGVLIHTDGLWLPMPLPGLAVALLDGHAGLLFPVPFLSMLLCWALLFLWFERLRARHAPAGEDAE